MSLSWLSPPSSRIVQAEIARLEAALARGEIAERADCDAYAGGTREVLAAVNRLLDSAARPVSDLSGAIARMSGEHDRGDIDVVIAAQDFSGHYAAMAEAINAMVAGHISVKKKAMACVKAFGEGDFSAPLEAFPGKKAFINDTIETLRDNLTGLIFEMNHMSAEHYRGDIDVIVPVERFKGDFGVVADGINKMVAGHIEVKKKAMACVKAFGEGDFDAHLEAFPGKKAFINETIETLRGNLRAITEEIRRLIAAATAGQLDERGDDRRFVGDFGALLAGINGMLDAILLPIEEGNRVLGEVSTGSLVEQVEIACEGDHQNMKNSINALIANLRTFAGNVGVAAGQVAQGSNQMATSSQQLSEGATEQAASAEEASASMEEMAANIKQNADNAAQTEKIARHCRRSA